MHLPSRLVRWLTGGAALLVAPLAASAMSVVPPTFDQLVGSATAIVRGVVTDIHCVAVNTSQGTAIRTRVTLQVERVLKGSAEGQVTLDLLGGRLGARTLSVTGMPTFKVGDRDIVFIANNGRAICPLLAAGHGRYHVRQDPATHREYVTRDNGAPLVSTDEVAQALDAGAHPAAPAAALTPEAFETRILATLRGSASPLQP